MLSSLLLSLVSSLFCLHWKFFPEPSPVMKGVRGDAQQEECESSKAQELVPAEGFREHLLLGGCREGQRAAARLQQTNLTRTSSQAPK